ncbi:uncharacterized protein LOC131022927 [Salvia miltiorrhiza]|uniref:uncharacterized protein LOC131022927 n=1 Tax=Salvia miltiorrhiza TaxID=226208 RepID=UPI0025AD1970|nr:uncharacterized protein LOC131022927 [Salvia miltiorrhiza]
MNKAQPLDCRYLAENNSSLAYNVEIPERNVEASRPFDAEEVDAGALVRRGRHSSVGDVTGTREEDIQVVDITDEERQEGLKKVGKFSEPARRSAGGVKILPPTGDKGKGPAKKSAGSSKALPSAGGKGKGKAVVPSADEPEDLVPGPISSLTGQKLIDALIARVHSQDQEKMEALTRGALATKLCQLALQMESGIWGAVKCIHDYDVSEKEREKEQADVAKRDDDVAGVVERLSKAEAEVIELKAKLAQMEVEKASLASELSRATKEGHECLARFKAGYERDYEEARRGWKRILVEAQNRAYVLGARDQRLEYFLSPRGQHFLGMMLEGTLESFKKTPEYLEDFGPLFAYEAAKLLDLGVRLPQPVETGPLPVFTEKTVSGHASASGAPSPIPSASAPVSSAVAPAVSVPPS